MALNSSGPISLGGSTVGQSVNLELKYPAVQTISLNDVAVRKLAGVLSGKISLPSNFWGKSSESYWISLFGLSGVTDNLYKDYSPMDIDDDGNIYVCISSNISAVTIKLDKTGQIISSNTVSSSVSKTSLYVYDFDLYNGNIYTASRLPNNTTYDYACMDIINTSSLQYVSPSRLHTGSAGVEDRRLYFIAINPNNAYKYTAFNIQSSSDVVGLVINDTNTVIGGINLSSTSDAQPSIPSFDSSNNVYWPIVEYTSTSSQNGTMYKFAHNLLSYSASRRSSNCRWYHSIVLPDSSVVWNTSIGSTASASVHGITKTDSSLNTIWCKSLNIPATGSYGYLNRYYDRTMSIDSDSNIYCLTANITNENHVIYKRSSSGVLLWQRNLTIVDSSGRKYLSLYKRLIVKDSSIYVYLGSDSVYINPTFYYVRPILLKLPTDGSLTGTYNIGGFTITYTESSYTESDQTITNIATISVTNLSSYASSTYNGYIQASITPTSTKLDI